MGCKLHENLRHKAVFSQTVDMRAGKMGDRLSNFGAVGGVYNSKINWRHGVYTPVFGEDRILHQVKHWNGDVVDVGLLGKQCARLGPGD